MILCPGDTLFWLDPDESAPCSKWVDVVAVNDFTVSVKDHNGVTFEVMPDELSYFEPEDDEENED